MAQIDSYSFDSIGNFLEQKAGLYAKNIAVSCLGHTLTYEELNKQSTNLASFLISLPNLKPGDRIAVQLPNCLEYPIAIYGVLRAGFVLVNTNPMYTPREMEHQFRDSGAKAVVILGSLTSKLVSFIDSTVITQVIVVGEHETQMQTQLHEFESIVNTSAATSFEKALKTSLSDVAIIQYTGGTTGVSKGASLSHGNIMANVHQTCERMAAVFEEGKEVIVCPLPLYHIYAFTVNLMCGANIGAHILLINSPQNPAEFVDGMSRFKATGFIGINTLFVALSQYPPFVDLDFSKLKLTMSGGATLTSDAASKWAEVTGCGITEGYGLSEASPVLTFNNPGEAELGSIGYPLVDTDIQIRDGNDQILPRGQEGELVAKGPQIMSGYWQRDDETKNAFTSDGYLKTGDVAKFLPSGAIKIVDRLKDMILVSGFNVYPNEIEDVLTRHPAISEAAVVGKPDNKTGEAVHAYITVSRNIDEAEAKEHCRTQLTAYKVPKHIHVMEALPKSTVGKILRKSLRD